MPTSRETNQAKARLRTTKATIVIAVMLIVYWMAIFYGTHMRLPPRMLPGGSDKVVHFCAYCGLGVLLMSLRATRGIFPWYSVFARWLVLAGYGAFDELTQLLVKRDAEVGDWIADVSGAAIGLGAFTFVLWLFRKKGTDICPQSP